MKKILLIISLVFAISLAFGSNALAKGQTQLNTGVGFSSDWGVPLYLGLDYGVHPDVTVGGEISFQSYEEKYHSYQYDHSIIGVFGNANYHFNNILEIPSNWDLYAGLSLGFYIWDSPDDYNGSESTGLGLAGQLGARYYFTDKFGVNLELGGGNAFSGGKAGISFRL